MPAYNGFPATYQPIYYQPYQMPYQQMQGAQQPVQAAQNAQNMNQQQYPTMQGGFVRVQSENEARMYPVAPGNSVTFINENAPYCYTKTVDMSQLDRPKFEKYRLVKEDDNAENAPEKKAEPTPDMSVYALKTDVNDFRKELETLKADIETFRGDLYGIAGKKPVMIKKKEEEHE